MQQFLSKQTCVKLKRNPIYLSLQVIINTRETPQSCKYINKARDYIKCNIYENRYILYTICAFCIIWITFSHTKRETRNIHYYSPNFENIMESLSSLILFCVYKSVINKKWGEGKSWKNKSGVFAKTGIMGFLLWISSVIYTLLSVYGS